MTTEPLVKPDSCTCRDWQETMPKLNGPIVLQTLRSGGSYRYDGKPFEFCPWCGTRLPSTSGERQP